MTGYPTSFVQFMQQNMENMAKYQEIALDFYAHQTAGIFGYWNLPGAHVVENIVAVQKSLLRLMTQESARAMSALHKEIPTAQPDEPNKDSADVVMAEPQEQESEAAIAAQMVDQIVADLADNSKKPVIQHVAMQQAAKAGAPAPRRQKRT